MAVKKKTPSPTGMSKKMLKRKKPINSNYFLDVGPITENQEFFLKNGIKVKTYSHLVQQVQVKHLLHCP